MVEQNEQSGLESEEERTSEKSPGSLMFGEMEFHRIPAGPFQMGSDVRKDLLAYDYEMPQHLVDISFDYWMARFPVTNEQYNTFMQAGKRGLFSQKHPVSAWEQKRDHPVVNVSWNDAMKYIRWLNDILKGKLPDGLILRLPTEAEWEKAARGFYGRIYPWGNKFEKNRCNTVEGGKRDTTPVNTYSPKGDSPFGCADMSGNVWEWTHSLYKRYPYRVDDGRENKMVNSFRVRRVLRGGGWPSKMNHVRVAKRIYEFPFVRGEWAYFGFRVAVAPALKP